MSILPLEIWPQQITQASVPANNNALRVEVLHRGALGVESTPPATPSERDVYIIGASPTGAWSAMGTGSVVVYIGGVWLEFEPFMGWVKYVQGDGLMVYDGADWVLAT